MIANCKNCKHSVICKYKEKFEKYLQEVQKLGDNIFEVECKYYESFSNLQLLSFWDESNDENLSKPCVIFDPLVWEANNHD